MSSSSSRIHAIDVVRGLCLFGILVINIQSFAMPHAAYLNPTVFGSLAGLDGVAWAAGRVFFDYKFLNLFAMLFGASMLLGADTTSPTKRLVWLGIFGLVHGYLVWYGDILFTYGVVGLVLHGLRARDWSPLRQLQVAVALVAVGPLQSFLLGSLFPHLSSAVQAMISGHLDTSTVAAELAAYRSGWLDQTPIRAGLTFESQTIGLVIGTGTRAAGHMLLGMVAIKLGLTDQRRVSKNLLIALWTVGLGLTLIALWVRLSGEFAPVAWLYSEALHELGAAPLACAYGLSIVGLMRLVSEAPLARYVAALGRVAFTAYLTQSLVGTFVFGGQGFGLFGTVGRAALFISALGFWSVQLVAANVWTKHFARGPFEALWRGLVRGDFSLHPKALPAP
jgi:uncharacterized protein